MAGSTDGLYYHSVAGVHGRPRLASVPCPLSCAWCSAGPVAHTCEDLCFQKGTDRDQMTSVEDVTRPRRVAKGCGGYSRVVWGWL